MTNSKWNAKCPAVIDTVGGDAPNVSGFYFDGQRGNFVRLDDNSATPATAPKSLLGCYADLTSLTNAGGNGYHVGTINRDSKGFYWKNSQGVRFGLTLSGMVMTTDKDNPYFSQGRQFVLKP